MKTETTLNKIKNIKIQGASQVALAYLLLLKNLPFNPKKRLIREIVQLKNKIIKLRPTEPLVINYSKLLVSDLNKKSLVNRRVARKEIDKLILNQKYIENRIIQAGSKLISNKDNIFTHCHSSVVENILIKAKNLGKNFQVYNSETRPLFQGRITSKNLVKHQIKVTQVCDSAAPFIISEHSGDDIKIRKVILGADSISENGWAVNKIGSFGLAITAWESKIPVYIAASLLKIYPKSSRLKTIPLEKRESREIWPEAPWGLKLENYAFDYIPAKFITAYITEFGLIRPKEVAKTAKKHYPEIF